jgi:hypothetical protein
MDYFARLATSDSDDESIDEAELCSTIGNDVWNDWCAGERAPEAA